MACTVEHYWEQHKARIEERFAVASLPKPGSDAEVLLIDGNTRRGVIEARIYFHEEDIFLDVHETVETTGYETGTPHRRRYAYQLMVRGVPVGRWHYDPELPEAERYHFDDDLHGQPHLPDSHQSLTKVILDCWPIITGIIDGMERPEPVD